MTFLIVPWTAIEVERIDSVATLICSRFRLSVHPRTLKKTLQRMVLGKFCLILLNSPGAPSDPLDLEQWAEQLQFGHNDDASVVEVEED